MFQIMSRKIISFLRQPFFVKCWFIPLWFLLGMAKLMIFIISFRKLAPLLGRHIGVNAAIPLASPEKEQTARLIGRALRLAAKYTPWDSNCFPQAVAARVLLGLYNVPYALYFGLNRNSATSEMNAHAWVRAGRVRVTGGESFGAFTVVSVFASNYLKND